MCALRGFTVQLTCDITNGKIISGIEQWRRAGEMMKVEGHKKDEDGALRLYGEWLSKNSSVKSEVDILENCKCYKILPPWEWKNSPSLIS